MERETVHHVCFVKFIYQSMIPQGVKSTIVPTVNSIVGFRIVIHRSPCRIGFSIQRAVLHTGYTVCDRADNMRALLARLTHINPLVFDHHSRFRIRGSGERNQGRSALTQLIDTCYIHIVRRQILQVRNGKGILLNLTGNLLISVITAFLFFEIHIIGKCILHLFPGHGNASELTHSLHIVRRIRTAAGLRYGLNFFSIAAAPGSVDSLYFHQILLIIGQFVIQIGSNNQRVACHHYSIRLPAFLPDGNFISGNVDAGIPGETDLLAARHRRQILGYIHLGLRYSFLHAVHKFNLGYLRQVTALPGSLDDQGHPLYRNLAAQIEPYIPLSVPLRLNDRLLQH